MERPVAVPTSGERLVATYRFSALHADPLQAARDLCVEQTVEFPADLLPPGDIPGSIVGQPGEPEPRADGSAEVRVSYAVETVGTELSQLLNVLFGNSSLKPGVRLQGFELPPSLAGTFRGPRFGRRGLRELCAAPERPLFCTALKPMGLGPRDLAGLAAQFARGGVDLLKDDHGLADQPFCPFEERVARVAEAVARVNAETGGRTLYAPNVSAPADQVLSRARFAREHGAGALLVAPGLVGFDLVRQLAEDDRIGLPILGHPALLGSYVTSPTQGIAHGALFGQLFRLAGVDATIFPHHGGRFSFSRSECRDLVRGTEVELAGLRPILPVPAGGMSLDRIDEIVAFYGSDVMLLIGGDLHRHPDGLEAACRAFRSGVRHS